MMHSPFIIRFFTSHCSDVVEINLEIKQHISWIKDETCIFLSHPYFRMPVLSIAVKKSPDSISSQRLAFFLLILL